MSGVLEYGEEEGEERAQFFSHLKKNIFFYDLTLYIFIFV